MARILTEERWRPVVGWEGLYEVSDHGRVRSLDRVVTRRDGVSQMHLGRVLSPGLGSSNRYSVRLCVGGRAQSRLVHRLVAEAFIPNPENHPLVLHWDDDPANNHVSNLRWGTHSDNQYDRVRNGTHQNGRAERTHCPQGHGYTPENTFRDSKGWRKCRSCDLQWKRESYQRKKKVKNG